jgi:hypothetical protein
VPLFSGTKPWVFQNQVGTVIAVSVITFLLVRALVTPDEESRAPCLNCIV